MRLLKESSSFIGTLFCWGNSTYAYLENGDTRLSTFKEILKFQNTKRQYEAIENFAFDVTLSNPRFKRLIFFDVGSDTSQKYFLDPEGKEFDFVPKIRDIHFQYVNSQGVIKNKYFREDTYSKGAKWVFKKAQRHDCVFISYGGLLYDFKALLDLAASYKESFFKWSDIYVCDLYPAIKRQASQKQHQSKEFKSHTISPINNLSYNYRLDTVVMYLQNGLAKFSRDDFKSFGKTTQDVYLLRNLFNLLENKNVTCYTLERLTKIF